MKSLPLIISLTLSAVAALSAAGASATARETKDQSSTTDSHYQVKVVDSVGQPICGALVECYGALPLQQEAAEAPHPEQQLTTDANGAATLLTTNSTSFRLVASRSGYSLAWMSHYTGLPGTDLEDNVLELTLTAPTTASGMVEDTEGKPVDDALVWVSYSARPGKPGSGFRSFETLTAPLARQLFAARTGKDGRFCLERLPSDATFNLAAAKPGLALDQAPQFYNSANLQFRAGQSNIVLTLRPAGAIEGRVVQEDTGAPVPAARILLTQPSPGQNGRPPVFTGPDGAFRLGELSPGEYVVRAQPGTNGFRDWVCETAAVTVAAGATNRDVKLVASRGGMLEVTVREEADNQPIADAFIGISGESASENATASRQGLARLWLLPGQYQLMVSKEGRTSSQSQLTIEKGQTNQVTVTLAMAPRITGLVTEPDGKPAAKVSVLFLFPGNRGSKRTDSEGRFTLTADLNRLGGPLSQLPAEQVVIARDPARNLAVALQLEEGSTNALLRLEPGLTLAGRVVDGKGQPVTNAQATLLFHTERMGSSFATPASTDAQGRFEFTALPRGRRYSVSVSARGFGQERRDVAAEVTGKPRVELEPFELPLADQHIAGVVVDTDDKPVPGAMVSSSGIPGDRQPRLTGRTDANGHFAFEQVCSGTIRLSAYTQRGSSFGNVTAEAGDTNIIIRLGNRTVGTFGAVGSFRSSGPNRLSGTVKDADGKPAAKAVVTVSPSSGSGTSTDAEGRFKLSLSPVQLGSIRVQRVVIARDLERNLAAALDIESEATNTDLRLEPGVALAGRILGSQGTAISNAEVQLMLYSSPMVSSLGSPIRTDADGRFEFQALPLGRRYRVTAYAKGYGQESRTVEAAEGDSRRVELEPFELLVANQRIAGVVLDENDKPVAGASLSLTGNKQPTFSLTADAKGHFASDTVCPGQLRLSARSLAGSFSTAVAEGGDTNIVIHLSASRSFRAEPPQLASLKDKPLPDLAPLGLAPADCPSGQPVLALLLDAEQRASRHAVRLLTEQAAALREKHVAVVLIQAGTMAEDALAAWKKEAELPFPLGVLKGGSDKARASWGAAALPWLILTDKTHRVAADGFAPEELAAKLKTLSD